VYTTARGRDDSRHVRLRDFQRRFALRVRALREERGLNQDALESHGLSWKTVQKLEYGKTNPKVGTLLKLCDAFKLTLSELLELDS
jgi:DNA-binding XRE family transcriptional regulator